MPEQGDEPSHTRTKSRIKRADNTGSEGCGYQESARRAKLGFAKQPEGRANSSSVVVVVVVVEEKEFEVAGGPKFSRLCCVDGEPSAVAVMNNGDDVVDGDDDDVPMPCPAPPRSLGGRISV